MAELIEAVANSNEKKDLQQFLHQLRQQAKSYLLRNDLLTAFASHCQHMGAAHPPGHIGSVPVDLKRRPALREANRFKRGCVDRFSQSKPRTKPITLAHASAIKHAKRISRAVIVWRKTSADVTSERTAPPNSNLRGECKQARKVQHRTAQRTRACFDAVLGCTEMLETAWAHR